MTVPVDIATILLRQAKQTLNAMGFGDNVIDIDPNIPFPVPATPTQYFEVRHFKNTPNGPAWGDGSIYQGFLQISLIDFQQRGEVAALGSLGQLLDVFHKGAIFWEVGTKVTIDKPPALLSVVQDGHKAIYPVSISYHATG